MIPVTIRLRPHVWKEIKAEAARSGVPIEVIINDRLDPDKSQESWKWIFGGWGLAVGALGGAFLMAMVQ